MYVYVSYSKIVIPFICKIPIL